VTSKIAAAIETFSAPGVHVRFAFCNLSEGAIFRLAEAVERNTTLKGFSCFQNPCNFSANGEKYPPYDPTSRAEQRVRQALVRTNAPLEIWNNNPLPDDIVKARQAKRALVRQSPAPVRANAPAGVHSSASVKEAKAGIEGLSLSVSTKTEKHLVFFSYCKIDTVAETLIFSQRARERYPKYSVFRDADAKFKLSQLILEVQKAHNIVVLLSGNYPRRPYTLIELHYALKSNANICAVKVTREGMPPFDFERVKQDIKNEKIATYLEEDAWRMLADHDIGVDDICKDLKNLMDVKAFEYSTSSSTNVQNAMLDDIFACLEMF